MLGVRDYFAIPQVLSSLLVAVSIDPMLEGNLLEGSTLEGFCKGWSPAMRAFVATLARSRSFRPSRKCATFWLYRFFALLYGVAPR